MDWRTCLECSRPHALTILVSKETGARTTTCKFCKDERIVHQPQPKQQPAKVPA